MPPTSSKVAEAMSNERPNKRARSAAACTRCKHRKQRCDNGIPACGACQLAGEMCSYENRVYPAEYVQGLETRLADLERQVQAQQQQQQAAQQQEAVSRLQQALPFGGPIPQGHQMPGAPALGQAGQQPILNVSFNLATYPLLLLHP